MRAFSGFPPGKTHNINMPELVFAELIPLVDDLAELKLTLHVLWRLVRQQGKVRYLRRVDLIFDEVLQSSLSGLGDTPIDVLDEALQRAVERGTLLEVKATVGGVSEHLYFVNTPKGRSAVEAIARGEWPDEIESAGRPNIFTMYEQNIGLLTPLITDELKKAEQEYPPEWIEEAFREAVSLNKRSWKYIRAILERWRVDGRQDEKGRRTGETDRRRYIKGEYGEYIKH
jgi:DNA replication protein